MPLTTSSMSLSRSIRFRIGAATSTKCSPTRRMFQWICLNGCVQSNRPAMWLVQNAQRGMPQATCRLLWDKRFAAVGKDIEYAWRNRDQSFGSRLAYQLAWDAAGSETHATWHVICESAVALNGGSEC